jgi:hypothetical protein
LEKLENKVTQSDGSWVCFCPACGEEGRNLRSKNHLRVWPDLRFNCVVSTGDRQHNSRILQLVGTESDGILTHYTARTEEPKIKQPATWPLSILDKLIFDYSYFESRGISAETQKHFRMGVASSGQLNGRAILPILSPQKDKIIGFTGRLINYTKWHKENKIPKWKHLNPSGSFLLVGDEFSIRESRTILITEGPADILALYEAGIRNTICLFGTTISSKQLGFLIKSNPLKIVIGLNNEPGNKNIGGIAAEKLRKTLLNYFSEERIIIALPKAKDYNDWLLEKNGKSELDEYRKTWLP